MFILKVGHALRFSAVRRNKKRGRPPTKTAAASSSAKSKSLQDQGISPLQRSSEPAPNNAAATTQRGLQGKLPEYGHSLALEKALTVNCSSSHIPATSAASPQTQLQTPGLQGLELHSTENNAVVEMIPPSIFAQFFSSQDHPAQLQQNPAGITPANVQAPKACTQVGSLPNFTATAPPTTIISSNSEDTTVDDLFAFLCSSSRTKTSQQADHPSQAAPKSVSVEIEDYVGHGLTNHVYVAQDNPTSIPCDASFHSFSNLVGNTTGNIPMILQDDYPTAVGDSSWMDRIFD